MTRGVSVSAYERRAYVSLRGRDRFRRVYRQGKRHRTSGLTVISCPVEPGPPQVGFVAGSRVGGAVNRNRAKRRLREAMRLVSLRPGTAYIVQATDRVCDAPFTELVAWLETALGRDPGVDEAKDV